MSGLTISLTFGAPIGCTAEMTGEAVDPISGGQPETGYPAVGEVNYDTGGGGVDCTGSLISPSWVLTAAHCYLSGANASFLTGTSPFDIVGHAVDGQVFHPTRDLMLLHLAAPITNILPLLVNTGGLPPFGTVCKGVGWGEPTLGYKRSATFQPYYSAFPWLYATGLSGNTEEGDSGGPLLCPGNPTQISGILYGSSGADTQYTITDLAWVNSSIESYGFRTYVEGYNTLDFGNPSVWVPITGDFNGDGLTDYARLSGSGAWIFYANQSSSNGVFGDPVWQDYSHDGLYFGDPPDNWPTITGDFNADGRTDYARVGSTGAWVFLAAGGTNAGFNEPLFQDFKGTNFGDPATNWQTITGDFNGDGRGDYARVGTSYAYIYYANTTGTNGGFNDAVLQSYGRYTRLPVANWPALTGDFNGDGYTDYARVGATSANVYYGGASCGGVPGECFSAAVVQHYPTNLNFGNPATNWVTFAGDFNHDGKTDYMRAGSTGAWIYTGASSGFNAGGFQDYTPNGLNFGDPATNWQTFAADFNGDGYTDYARIGETGAWIFLASGNAVFTPEFETYDGLDFGAPSPWQVVSGKFASWAKASYVRLGGPQSYVFAQQ